MDGQRANEAVAAEDGKRIIPAEYRCLSGSILKLIAVATMLLDHVSALLLIKDPTFTTPVITLSGTGYSLYFIFRSIGRIAFPIFVFLLVEGFIHTRNRLRYGLSLGVFALVSEPIWDFAHFGVISDPSSQNVFFTLLIIYIAMCLIEEFDNDQLIVALGLAACVILAFTLLADYGVAGLALGLVTYGLRKHEALRFAASICVLNFEPQAALVFPFMALYNGKRGFVGKGTVVKYAFYAFYPVHLLVLGLIRWHVGLF